MKFAAALLLLLALAAPRSSPAPTSPAAGDVSRFRVAASDQGTTGAPVGPAAFGVVDLSSPPPGAPLPAGIVPPIAAVHGWATTYAACRRCAAAGPELRAMLGRGWLGKVVRVTGDAGGVVDVRLVTSCACGDRRGFPTVIDLSPDAFAVLRAHPGIVMVTVERTTLPATDTEEAPE